MGLLSMLAASSSYSSSRRRHRYRSHRSRHSRHGYRYYRHHRHSSRRPYYDDYDYDSAYERHLRRRAEATAAMEHSARMVEAQNARRRSAMAARAHMRNMEYGVHRRPYVDAGFY